MSEVATEQSPRPKVESVFFEDGQAAIRQVLQTYDNGHVYKEIQFPAKERDGTISQFAVVRQFGMDSDTCAYQRRATFEATVDFAIDALMQIPEDPLSKVLHDFVDATRDSAQKGLAAAMTAAAAPRGQSLSRYSNT